jgi:RNA polymerase sigma-70 factor, ECF subfamily
MTDEEQRLATLIKRSQEGDEDAFRELYEQLVDRVYSYTRSRLFSSEDALDATQQMFIDLWKALPRFEFQGIPQFYGFLFTILKRQIIKVRAHRNRDPQAITHEELLPEHAHDRETEALLKSALRTLSKIDRDIVILHHWSRYTFGEIGAMLNLTEANIRVRHHRALKALKHYLSQ